MLLLVAVWFFRDALALWWHLLIHDDRYSFAILIPPVIGYIIYQHWARLKPAQWRPSWWGLAVIGAGVCIRWVGVMLAINYIQPFSFLVVVIGSIWLFGGSGVLRNLTFPLVLLWLTIPLPSMVLLDLSLKLQLLSTRWAGIVLHWLGYAVHIQGNIIDLGSRQLQVAEACSGLGYLFNGLILGLIFAYFFQRCWWKAALLLLAIIPAAVLANTFRLVSIVIWPIFEEGFWHYAFGLSIFIVGFDYLRGVNWLLQKLKLSDTSDKIQPKSAEPVKPPYYFTNKRLVGQCAAALLVLIVGGTIAQRLYQIEPVPLRQNLSYFPLQLGSWQGLAQKIEPAIEKRLGFPEYLDINYTNPDHGWINFWLAYYDSQNKDIRRAYHSPMYCLPGAGWKIIKRQVIEVASGQPVNYLLMEQGKERLAVYYWFWKSGRWVASEYWLRFYMGLDGLIWRRNDGALIRLSTPAPNEEAARARLNEFLNQIKEVLPQFLPG